MSYIGIGLRFKRNIVGRLHRKISPIIDQIRSGTREILCKGREIVQILYMKILTSILKRYLVEFEVILNPFIACLEVKVPLDLMTHSQDPSEKQVHEI